MYCEEIALNVPHFTKTGQRKDSCFVLKVSPGSGRYYLINNIGEAYVDSHSMHNFIAWCQDENAGDIYVLASLDLKYLVISESLHHILPEECPRIAMPDSEGVRFGHLEELKDRLEAWAAREPWVYEELKMKLPKLKTRTDLSQWVIYEFDPLVTVMSGLDNPETADIAHIAWGYPIAQLYSKTDLQFDYWHFQERLAKRLSNPQNLNDGMYDATGLTLGELDRRAERSWNLSLIHI